MVSIVYTKEGYGFAAWDPKEYLHTLIYAASGYGKTLQLESMIQAIREIEKKAVIIHLTDSKSMAEATALLYAPDAAHPAEHYQLDALDEQGETPQAIPHENVKMYELVSTTLLDHQHDITPPIHYFTISIKEITRDILSFLLETPEQPALATIIINKIQKLTASEDLFDLVNALRTITQETPERHQEQFFMDGITASFESVKNIILRLSPLAETPIIMHDTCFTNLHATRIINDWKHTHIFLNRYNTDDKLRDLHACWLLSQLLTIPKEKIKHPIFLIIDELRIFSPQDKSQSFYKIPLQEILAKLLAIGRSKGITILSTTQTINGIDKKIIRAFPIIIPGKIPDMEMKSAGDIMRLEKEDLLFLNDPGNKHGVFTVAKNAQITDAGGFQTSMIRHYHANPDFNAYQRYHTHFGSYEQTIAENTTNALLTLWNEKMRKHKERKRPTPPPKEKKQPPPPLPSPSTLDNVTALKDALKNLNEEKKIKI